MNKKRGYYTTKLGGKSRTLHFSFPFWANLTEELNIGLESVGEAFGTGFNMTAFRALIYAGCKAYDQENNIEIDYNIYNVGEWLSDLEAQEIEKIMTAMSETRILGNDLNMGIERNPEAKKPTAKAKKKS